jgi:amino-acid N-acetyltransferase
LSEIREILKNEDLPFNDLTENHLKSFLIIRDRNKIIGIVGSEIFKSSALLRSLVVLVEFKQKNIATQRVAQIESWLIRQDITTLYLLTTTATDFFLMHKFEGVNRSDVPSELLNTEEFTSLCPDTTVCMVKKFT